MKLKNRFLAVFAGAIALSLVVPVSAHAANYNVWGDLNSSGSLIQYSTFRPHSTGPAGLNITKNVIGGNGGSGGSHFGLRNTSNVQVTTTRNWINNGTGTQSNTGYKSFANASNLTSTIPGGNLAMNGRMTYIGGGYYNIRWEGVLSLNG